MTSKREDMRVRKDTILGITIDHYIKTFAPISSQFIASQCRLDLSPATIRNVLAELEEEGYLTHPHTSAGRVPTEKGYRYYVDNLMNEINLLEEEKYKIKSEYYRESLELERMLDKTSHLLSDVTHYTSIISLEGKKEKVFLSGTRYVVEYPEFPDIQKIKKILAALEEKEMLLEVINQKLRQKVDIYIGHELAMSEMDSCSLVVSSFKTHGISGRIAVLGPTRMQYNRVVSTVDYLSKLIEEII